MSELKICIVGIGLIGGSIGLALKKELRDKVCISGLDKNRETLRIAVERGAVDMATSDYAQAVKDADIIFLDVYKRQI